MEYWIVIVSVVAVVVGAAALVLALLAMQHGTNAGLALTEAQLAELLRTESDRMRAANEEQVRGLRQELGDRLDKGIRAIDDRATAIGKKLDGDLARMGDEAMQNRDVLRKSVEDKLDSASTKQSSASKELRDEVNAGLERLGNKTSDTLVQIGNQQKERLDNVGEQLRTQADKHEKSQEALRQTVEGRLDAIRLENSAKLDEMRRTVDEKLQTTLEQRLGESFNRVVEQLERVHKGIGEMQTLAAGVGDLKMMLSNVTVRGAFGELQLAVLLEQFLSPEQYVENATVKDGSAERVEFAVRLPGRAMDCEVLLPIDAKFPKEDYERLLKAVELRDTEASEEASKALEIRIRLFAKTISEKYINPPRTTDFAILFLPTEGLYAEVLRRPGLFEQIQRDFHVTLTGPTTLNAFLNALHMGFRTVAIEKRSSEVWQVLGAVRNEFGKYNEVVDKIARNLTAAANTVETLGKRTRAMNRKLRDVETVSGDAAQTLLGFSGGISAPGDEEDVDESLPAAD
jgi:DNA recombination protein RmuC